MGYAVVLFENRLGRIRLAFLHTSELAMVLLEALVIICRST